MHSTLEERVLQLFLRVATLYEKFLKRCVLQCFPNVEVCNFCNTFNICNLSRFQGKNLKDSERIKVLEIHRSMKKAYLRKRKL